jgi:hypothetical protein
MKAKAYVPVILTQDALQNVLAAAHGADEGAELVGAHRAGLKQRDEHVVPLSALHDGVCGAHDPGEHAPAHLLAPLLEQGDHVRRGLRGRDHEVGVHRAAEQARPDVLQRRDPGSHRPNARGQLPHQKPGGVRVEVEARVAQPSHRRWRCGEVRVEAEARGGHCSWRRGGVPVEEAVVVIARRGEAGGAGLRNSGVRVDQAAGVVAEARWHCGRRCGGVRVHAEVVMILRDGGHRLAIVVCGAGARRHGRRCEGGERRDGRHGREFRGEGVDARAARAEERGEGGHRAAGAEDLAVLGDNGALPLLHGVARRPRLRPVVMPRLLKLFGPRVRSHGHARGGRVVEPHGSEAGVEVGGGGDAPLALLHHGVEFSESRWIAALRILMS